MSSCFVTGLASETKLDLIYDAASNSITLPVWHKHATWKININIYIFLKTVKSNPTVNCQFRSLLALLSFLTENIHQKTNLDQNQYLNSIITVLALALRGIQTPSEYTNQTERHRITTVREIINAVPNLIETRLPKSTSNNKSMFLIGQRQRASRINRPKSQKNVITAISQLQGRHVNKQKCWYYSCHTRYTLTDQFVKLLQHVNKDCLENCTSIRLARISQLKAGKDDARNNMKYLTKWGPNIYLACTLIAWHSLVC